MSHDGRRMLTMEDVWDLHKHIAIDVPVLALMAYLDRTKEELYHRIRIRVDDELFDWLKQRGQEEVENIVFESGTTDADRATVQSVASDVFV